MLVHPIPPIYSDASKILILGSFPSVRSREAGFFYGHPQNRFWKVLAAVLNTPLPKTVDEKKEFLLDHHIALWDVAAACEIQGSADNTIKKVTANDISCILKSADIAQIYVNGQTAARYYHQLIEPTVGRAAITLPSTSPANASQSLEDLICAWRTIRDYCQ
jgi:hypoxanthine-DNA glycosylase